MTNSSEAAPGGDLAGLDKSRSQKKRESTALQKLGEDLAALAPALLEELALSADLAAAIDDLRHMKTHEARRRQNQLLGRHMRELDEAEQKRIAVFISHLNTRRAKESKEQHRLEQWREALLDEEGREAALAEIAASLPAAAIKQLRHLAEAAVAGRGASTGVKARRELLRALKKAAGLQ